MADNTKKQSWKFQIANSDRIETQELKAAAKRFKQYALDVDMTHDELFIQLVKTLPTRK